MFNNAQGLSVIGRGSQAGPAQFETRLMERERHPRGGNSSSACIAEVVCGSYGAVGFLEGECRCGCGYRGVAGCGSDGVDGLWGVLEGCM